MTRPALELVDLCRHYREGEARLDILIGASLTLYPGDTVALVAPSGAGKSTLLHIAGLLEQADSGEVRLDGKATSQMSDDARTRLRRNSIGFVYQFHHLLPEFTALENAVLPQTIAGYSRKEATARAQELLDYLGIGARATHRPGELSGGEQQRVAIARAVANAPAVLLADEPTGNLDPRTAAQVLELLGPRIRRQGGAGLLITHSVAAAATADRAYRFDGRSFTPLVVA